MDTYVNCYWCNERLDIQEEEDFGRAGQYIILKVIPCKCVAAEAVEFLEHLQHRDPLETTPIDKREIQDILDNIRALTE